MQTPGAKKRGSVTVYVLMSLVIAFASSLFNPVLSYYLKTEIGLDPLHISLFFILLPIATIIIVQTVAVFSDKGLQRPAIICIAAVFGILSSLLLQMRPGFLVLCTVGLICLGSYPVAFPQIFASAREFAAKHVSDSIMFTTFLRALISLSWVVGPPVAYAVAIGVSFDLLFAVTAASFLTFGVISYFWLPDVLEHKPHDKSNNIKWWSDRSVLLLCIAFSCMFTAFSSYITVMPLYVTQEIMLPENLPGYIMGLAAFLEIPIMLVAARMSKKIGLRPMILSGAVFLAVYLFSLPYLTTSSSLLWMQILPAIYISFIGAMGMVMFQELLPAIPGQATSLYINSSTAGQILGGAMISLAASGSYSLVFIVGGIMSLIGTVLILFVRKTDGKNSRAEEIIKAEKEAAAAAENNDAENGKAEEIIKIEKEAAAAAENIDAEIRVQDKA